MRSKSIVAILKLFNSEQVKRLASFVISPYFNTSVEISKLLEFHILNRDTNLDELEFIQQAYYYVYNSSEFNPKKYNSLNKRTLKIVEEFIIVESNLKDEVNCMTVLLSKYGEWHSVAEYQAVSHSLEKFLAKEMNIDHNYVQQLNQVFLIKNKYSHNGEIKKYDELLKNTSDKLDMYYIQTKLRIAYEVLSRREWKHSNTSTKLLNELIDIVDKNDYRREKYINMYYLFLKSSLEPDVVQHYYELKHLLLYNSSEFTQDERSDLLTTATNYCTFKINTGNHSFNEELYNLYVDAIAQNVLLYRGELSSWLFTNIVVSAQKLFKLDWAENFIQEYNKYVIDQWNNTYYYNLAFIEFEKSNFELAHKLLIKMDEQDFFYQLRAKTLLLKIYYEKKEFPPLISLIESFKKLIIRNKILNEAQKNIYFHFLKYLNSLVVIPDGDNIRIRTLRAIVEKDNIVTYRGWLLRSITKKIG